MHRGYVEGLEHENAVLKAQLKAHGIREDGRLSSVDQTIGRSTPDRSGTSNSPQAPNSISPSQTLPHESPSYELERTPDNYLGVALASSRLSSINGTALSILGMKIDIADFESLDMDEPSTSGFNPRLYNKSYQSFLQTALNVNEHMEEPPLPLRDEAFIRIEWYFRMINPYIPFLHKPTFVALVGRFLILDVNCC
jgi:hypothetical protein